MLDIKGERKMMDTSREVPVSGNVANEHSRKVLDLDCAPDERKTGEGHMKENAGT